MQKTPRHSPALLRALAGSACRHPGTVGRPPRSGDGYIWTPGYSAGADGRLQPGPRRLDRCRLQRRTLDAGLLGLRQRRLPLERRLLGPYVGYYGGINYGFGYVGSGFAGGHWERGRYHYNRAYCNFGRGYNYHNVYNRPYNGYNGHAGGASFTRTS